MPILKLESLESQALLTELGRLIQKTSHPQVPITPPSIAEILIRGAKGLEESANPAERSSPLIQCFFLDKTLPIKELQEALGTLPIEGLEQMGLVDTFDDQARAAFRIGSLSGRLIISDWTSWRTEQAIVPGINPAGITLSHFIPKRPVGKALDLGTGSGLLAILSAEWAKDVVATDINPRALEFARASACLNGITNLDLRHGSWLDPVQGELFDLVACNPPFVISPERLLIYRDGTESSNGEDLCARLISDLPGVLAAGGIAIMTVSWACHKDEDTFAEPLHWIEDLDLPCVILSCQHDTPERYAWWWQLTPMGFPADSRETVRRWVDYYQHLGIEEIHTGLVAFRRSSEPTRRQNRAVTASAVLSPGEAAEKQLMAMLNAVENCVEDDETLLASVPHFTGPHDALQVLRYRDGSHSADTVRFSWPEGLGAEVAVDPHMLHMVLSIDSHRSLRELIRSLWPEESKSGSALHELCTAILELHRAGLVELVHEASS